MALSKAEGPFDKPFDKLTVLSKVEGLTVLSKVEGLMAPSKVEGLRYPSSFVTVAYFSPSTQSTTGVTVGNCSLLRMSPVWA